MRAQTCVRLVLALALAPVMPLACNDATAPGPGDLIIEFRTSGIDPDGDGYIVTLDGGLRDLVLPNGQITIADLEPGPHVLRIEGQLPSCTIEGPNPRTVVIARGASTTARFTVTCVARFGYIDVAAATTGRDRDLDGYRLTLDGLDSRQLSESGTLRLGPLEAGAHTVALGGVARNCDVALDSVRVLTVAAGVTTDVEFTVTCAAFASIRLAVVTTGADLDRDYWYSVASRNDFRFGVLASNASVRLDSLRAGTFDAALYDVATNCDADVERRTVTAVAGDTVTVPFTIVCGAARQLAFTGEVTAGLGVTTEIYVAKSNGTGVTRLTTDQFDDSFPAWSPDGGRIAFSSRRGGNTDVYVMSANGSDPIRLTTTDSADFDPAWSPDGSRIAFVSRRDGDAEIYVMNADGSNPVRLTNSSGPDVEPAWSPDGAQIAFRSNRDGNGEIYVMTPTGTAVTRLTRNAFQDRQPAWSPDGARLAFSSIRDGTSSVVVSNADGSGETLIYSEAHESEPAWSPDGSRLAYATFYCEDLCYKSSLEAMRPDGTRRTGVRYEPSFSPAWRP